MVAGCGAKISKMILFLFNFLVWLVSIILIGLGGYVLARDDEYSGFFGTDTNYFVVVCWSVIAVGCFIFFVAFAGCFGAVKESSCLLKFYFFILFLLIVLEVAGGVVALVFRGKIEEVLEDNMEEQVKDYKPLPNKKKNFVDVAQEVGGCCGVNSYVDYNNTEYVRTGTAFVPVSCCINEDEAGCNDKNNEGNDIADIAKIKTKGCLVELVDTAKEYFLIIGAVALAMIAVEILAMIFTCCVISGINNGEYE